MTGSGRYINPNAITDLRLPTLIFWAKQAEAHDEVPSPKWKKAR